MDTKTINIPESRTFEIMITLKELKLLGFNDWPNDKELISAIHEAIYLADARV